ncbi:hypothetical protein DFQ01_12539 [Paenibacillus cellulosilyticus]|uniref:Transmembrane protein n=1 Tax=Paenibacillus cellulosilyticus TaxID=375489 RepID=A0A2V2YN22_9BACL|nr:hypothetical protein [Paenibacillus cellulosilyticus]PWV95695.1 hypothetical protein DFQ01_12539 [Paenibacillus cellulosilyticus]QKS47669.1 hypothetical protein HUB94_25245 [Paenibacillus cellulosilyticus]
MKLEFMYAAGYRTCDTCSGTGRHSSSSCAQQSRIAKDDGTEWSSMDLSKGAGSAANRAAHAGDTEDEAALCVQCAGVGSVRVERVATLSLEASIISLCIASCVAAYTGRPLMIALFLTFVLFAARMISFRTERYLLKKRHASKCSSSTSSST